MIVPERLLHGITGLPEEELRGALSHLQTGEFLYESNLYPKLEYKFTHALINEVVYGSLLHERRTALHAQTAAAIERLTAAICSTRLKRSRTTRFAASYGKKPPTI